jgi:hypothetical protein
MKTLKKGIILSFIRLPKFCLFHNTWSLIIYFNSYIYLSQYLLLDYKIPLELWFIIKIY